MSPLGELYRREAIRLSRRYPALDVELIDRLVTLSLARAFLNTSVDELAVAVMEAHRNDGPNAQPAADAIYNIVINALLVAASERQQDAHRIVG